jgi:hypothetical protein
MSFGLIARALAIRPVEIRLTFSVVSMRGVLGAGAILSMLFLASSYISTGRRESELLTLVEYEPVLQLPVERARFPVEHVGGLSALRAIEDSVRVLQTCC